MRRTRHWMAMMIAFLAFTVAREARAEWVYVERESPFSRRHAYLSAEAVGVLAAGTHDGRWFAEDLA